MGGGRGELFCGFHRREAEGREGPAAAAGYRPRRLRPKTRLVSDQRAGGGSVADAGAGALVVAVAAGGAVAGSGVCEGMVTGGMAATSAWWEQAVRAA